MSLKPSDQKAVDIKRGEAVKFRGCSAYSRLRINKSSKVLSVASKKADLEQDKHDIKCREYLDRRADVYPTPLERQIKLTLWPQSFLSARPVVLDFRTRYAMFYRIMT